MKAEDKKWEKETELYFLVADKYVKFGITSNWARREKTYLKNELQHFKFQKVKTVPFEFRWQAELIEQVMRYRLDRWKVPDRQEWMENLTLQNVVDCYQEVYKELSPEFQKHQHIHKHGNESKEYYKQIAASYFG